MMESPVKEGRLSRLRRGVSGAFIKPLVPVLAATGLTPDQVTFMGLAVAGGAAALAATDHLVIAGLLVLVGGLFDLMDGALARATQRSSTRGAFLDSNLDRVSEGAILFGLLVHFARQDATQEILLIFLVVTGSLLVSYVKARAEGLGLSCNVGFFTRPERVILLAIGLLAGHLLVPLYLLAVLSFMTAGQRFLHVWRQRDLS
jgi:CDP-diacylglycerol--glycerol-3-phosphate 3-phosphatidyltransferase